MATMRIYKSIAFFEDENEPEDNEERLLGYFRHKSKAERVSNEFKVKMDKCFEKGEPTSPPERYDWKNVTDDWLLYFRDSEEWNNVRLFQECRVEQYQLSGER